MSSKLKLIRRQNVQMCATESSVYFDKEYNAWCELNGVADGSTVCWRKSEKEIEKERTLTSQVKLWVDSMISQIKEYQLTTFFLKLINHFSYFVPGKCSSFLNVRICHTFYFLNNGCVVSSLSARVTRLRTNLWTVGSCSDASPESPAGFFQQDPFSSATLCPQDWCDVCRWGTQKNR